MNIFNEQNQRFLDCKDGHMKKNRLSMCVCLHLGSKKHQF